jgi:hypothetical protein
MREMKRNEISSGMDVILWNSNGHSGHLMVFLFSGWGLVLDTVYGFYSGVWK